MRQLPSNRPRYGFKAAAAALAAAAVTWDPANSGTNAGGSGSSQLILSGDRLTQTELATVPAGINACSGVSRATLSRAVAAGGKYCFGFSGTAPGGATGFWSVGFDDGTPPYTEIPGLTAHGIGWRSNGSYIYNGATHAGAFAAVNPGDNVVVGIDVAAKTSSVWVNGVLGATSVALSNGVNGLLDIAAQLFPIAWLQCGHGVAAPQEDLTMALTSVFTRAAMPFVPAGYLAWDGT